MFVLVKRLYAVQLVRFGTVGVLVTGSFMGLNALFARGFGWSAQVAFLAAYPPALCLHFLLNKLWTFGDRRATSRRHVLAYLFTAAVTFAIQWPAFTLLQTAVHAPGWLAAGGANVLQMAVSFLLLRRKVFAQVRTSPEPGGRGGTEAPLAPLRVGAAVAIACGLVAAFDLWSVSGTPGSFDFGSPKEDYYNLLVQGFQGGHLYLNHAPDPALLALPEGSRPGSAPFLLDASLYRGHYYLYFGPTPAVLLFWPYAVLTGHSLPQGVAALICAWLGTGFAVLIWLEVRRRWFPQAGAVWTGLAVLAIGVGSGVPSALRHPLFYEVATGAGFAFTMIELWCLGRARGSGLRSWAWLACAGVATGLATGARANLAPAGVLVLGLGCAGVVLAVPQNPRRRLGALLGAGLGVGAIGGGLAAYNIARFGNPLEFGHAYQFGTNPRHMFQAANFWHNLGVYYLSPPEWNAYFPFVSPPAEPPKPFDYVGREHAHGEWIWLPLVVAGLWAALGSLRRQPRESRRELAWTLALPGLIFLVNFLLTSSAGVRANRYMMDFHPALIVTVLSALGLGWGAGPRVVRGFAGLTGLGFAAVALFNVVASMQVHGFFAKLDPAGYDRIARMADRIAWPLVRTGARVGDREVLLRWPAITPVGAREPLGGAGTPAFDDVLWVDYGLAGRVRLAYTCAEMGAAVGDWFTFQPGATARLRITGAFLLPRVGHPWYGDRAESIQRALKRTLAVSVDGQIRLDRAVPSHDSSPRLQSWGAWTSADGQTRRFSGKILGVDPRSVDEGPARQALAEEGTLRLRIGLPQDRYGLTEPLAEFGGWSHFDLVAVRYVRAGFIQLIHDQSGGGATRSAEIAADYRVQHEVEIETPQATDDLVWRRLGPVQRIRRAETIRVRLDGAAVFESGNPPYHYPDPAAVLGADLAGSSASGALYSGAFLAEPRLGSLGNISTGSLEFPRRAPDPLEGERGVLLRLTSAGGDRANLIWRRASDSEAQVGWNDLDTTVWSATRVGLESGPLEIRVEGGTAALDSVAIYAGSKRLLTVRSDLFADGPVRADALRPEDWSGSARMTRAPTAAVSPGLGPAGAAGLPGIVRIRFGLPNHRLAAGLPLLSAGSRGAADSVYLRELPDGRFVLGVDHWMFSATESAPFQLAPGESHAAVIELGSLTGALARNYVHLWMDGQSVLDRPLDLYPVKASEVVFGVNPLGMSTSAARFDGTLLAVRRHLPPR